jgi:hypothetical protein
MINLTISTKLTAKQTEEVQAIISFLNASFTIKAQVEIVGSGQLWSGTDGVCSPNGLIKVRKQRDFSAVLNILCHEITHAMQYCTGRLTQTEEGWTWDGEFYPNSTKYAARPWEVDAEAGAISLLARAGA